MCSLHLIKQRLVAELREQVAYCQLTLLELHEKGDVAEESMTKLTNLVEDMSIDLTGSAKMAKLVKEIEAGNEANHSKANKPSVESCAFTKNTINKNG